jgi:hypothetical protein
VADAAPNALIVVTGYPYLFDPDPNNPIITAFNAATTALNTTIEAAVNAMHNDNIVYVDVTDQFKGHGIGSSDPFINDATAVEGPCTLMLLATVHMPMPSQLRYYGN